MKKSMKAKINELICRARDAGMADEDIDYIIEKAMYALEEAIYEKEHGTGSYYTHLIAKSRRVHNDIRRMVKAIEKSDRTGKPINYKSLFR